MNLINRFRASYYRIGAMFWNWMWLKSDVKFRRMCVMASLHAQLAKCSTDDDDAITLLNQHMGLVNDFNAMRLPTLFAGLIWKNLPAIERLDTDNKNLVTRIVRQTPCWLYYTSEQGYESDIKDLLGFCQRTCVPT